MKLSYFTESGYEQLYKNIEKNIGNCNYNKEDKWIKEVLNIKPFYKESKIVISPITLIDDGDNLQNDIINTKIIFDALKDKLQPKQASNVYLWSYLTHETFYNYTIRRWKTRTIDSIKDRFFCDSYSGSRIGLLRNSISRLWWYGYLTYLENEINPYTLTELLLSNSDLCLSLVERKFSMNKNIIVGILKAIKQINNEYPKSPVIEFEWRSLSKYMNRHGGVTILDFLSVEEVEKISIDYIIEMRKKK